MPVSFVQAAGPCLRAAGMTLGAAFILAGLASVSFLGMISVLDGDAAAVRLASGLAFAALEAVGPR